MSSETPRRQTRMVAAKKRLAERLALIAVDAVRQMGLAGSAQEDHPSGLQIGREDADGKNGVAHHD